MEEWYAIWRYIPAWKIGFIRQLWDQWWFMARVLGVWDPIYQKNECCKNVNGMTVCGHTKLDKISDDYDKVQKAPVEDKSKEVPEL